MAAPNDLQSPVVLSLEAIEITQREDGVRLRIILVKGGDATVVVAGANLMAVPSMAFVTSRP